MEGLFKARPSLAPASMPLAVVSVAITATTVRLGAATGSELYSSLPSQEPAWSLTEYVMSCAAHCRRGPKDYNPSVCTQPGSCPSCPSLCSSSHV